jgi:RNA polymerase sigma-70 factor (ECF subfamily)
VGTRWTFSYARKIEDATVPLRHNGMAEFDGPRGFRNGARCTGLYASSKNAQIGDNSEVSRPEAFRLFVEPEIPVLLRVARSLTGNSSDAEDLVQETLIKAFGALDNFDGAHPRAWLLTILRNTSKNAWRKKKPDYVDDWNLVFESKPAFNAEPPISAEDEVMKGVMDPTLVKAVNELGAEFRATLMLIDVEGFSYAECAEILGVPIGTIMSRRSRALAKIRKSLAKAREGAVTV